MSTIPRTPEEYRAWWSKERPDIPYGLCWCGCGERTKIARQTHTNQRTVGEPCRYLKSHHKLNVTKPDWIIEDRGYETPCKIWQKYKIKGYGVRRISGHNVSMHRHAYEAAYGPIPKERHVHHLCEQPACVEHTHLSLRTPLRHISEHSRGEGNYSSKLTEDKVREIRRMSHEGLIQKDISLAFGVSRGMVGHIVRRDAWKHIA